MRSVSVSFAIALALGVLGGLWTIGAGTDPARESDPETPSGYESHYLVFGTRDASGMPRLLALDFNRTERGPDRVAYEYKLFVARGGDWSMPVYETWEAAPDRSVRFPDRGGLAPTLTEDGVLRRVRADLSDLTLVVAPKRPSFPFPKGERAAPGGTAHPPFTVQWNGTTYRGPGVYEWIPPGSSTARTTPEEKRQLDEEATFGLYDWIVLYDEKGRLWHVSQGTLTPDFAYQQVTGAIPGESHDVLVQWLATKRDPTAHMHSPTAWLVDVPAWQMRVRLQKTGEHRGHGSLRADGTRPIYVQASVEGRGLIRGKEQQFFGMIEHIRD